MTNKRPLEWQLQSLQEFKMAQCSYEHRSSASVHPTFHKITDDAGFSGVAQSLHKPRTVA